MCKWMVVLRSDLSHRWSHDQVTMRQAYDYRQDVNVYHMSNSLTHSLTHSLIHSLTRSLTTHHHHSPTPHEPHHVDSCVLRRVRCDAYVGPINLFVLRVAACTSVFLRASPCSALMMRHLCLLHTAPVGVSNCRSLYTRRKQIKKCHKHVQTMRCRAAHPVLERGQFGHGDGL